MPYVHDKGFVLSPEQEALRTALVAAATVVKNTTTLSECVLGTLVQPAHTLEGGTLNIPERRFVVSYQRHYGVVCHRLCTSNGSAWEIASCVRDDTRWEPETSQPRSNADPGDNQ